MVVSLLEYPPPPDTPIVQLYNYTYNMQVVNLKLQSFSANAAIHLLLSYLNDGNQLRQWVLCTVLVSDRQQLMELVYVVHKLLCGEGLVHTLLTSQEIHTKRAMCMWLLHVYMVIAQQQCKSRNEAMSATRVIIIPNVYIYTCTCIIMCMTRG